MFSVSFVCHIVSYWEKMISNLIRNVVAILPLKSKLSWKFQRFNAVNRDIQMQKIVKFSKISIQIKNCKIFGRSKQWTAFRNLFNLPPSHPHQKKLYYVLETKTFLGRYIEIYRLWLSKSFKDAVLWCQEMV